MARHIVIIQGHPDARGHHFGHALAEAYRQGAAEAGHEVKTIAVAQLDFPLLRAQQDFSGSEPPEAIRDAQQMISWAEHLVIVYPLWIGTMPALLKAFFEQVMRPGFAFTESEGKWPRKLLQGRSARVIITMGMPAFIFRWYYRAHSLKSLERNILGFCGIGPIKETLIGMVESEKAGNHQKWLERMQALGRAGK